MHSCSALLAWSVGHRLLIVLHVRHLAEHRRADLYSLADPSPKMSSLSPTTFLFFRAACLLSDTCCTSVHILTTVVLVSAGQEGLAQPCTLVGCALMAFIFFLSLLKSSSTSSESLAALLVASLLGQSVSAFLPLVSPALFLSSPSSWP